MNASHRRTALAHAPARRGVGTLVVAGALVASLVACGSAITSPPASGPAGSTPPAATGTPATPAPTPTPAYADTLRIGHAGEFALMLARGWQGGELMGVPSLTFGELVYSGLYRYDGKDNAVPDLADGDCFVPGSDSRVLRCRLVETTFHDGSPLTADDVASTYQVFMRPINASALAAERGRRARSHRREPGQPGRCREGEPRLPGGA